MKNKLNTLYEKEIHIYIDIYFYNIYIITFFLFIFY